MRAVVHSPAKLNLLLAITGRRADGFHDLVSVAAPVKFGDDLEAAPASSRGAFTLECDDARVPVDASNLILRAAESYAARTGWRQGVHFKLTKRIPIGAGLGGGSSNAIAALRALNELSGGVAEHATLHEIAETLGSDCPLFLAGGPVAMRGRGERIEVLAGSAAQRIRGRSVLVFKPSFAISTPWAYRRMIERAGDYVAASEVERRLAEWVAGRAPLEALLANNMEAAAFEKYLALPVLLAELHRKLGVSVRMSGSGSACFALLRDEAIAPRAEEMIRAAWGDAAWVISTKIA